MGLIRKGQKAKGRQPRATGTTIIAAGSRLVGDLSLEGALHVDGTIEGTITSSGDVSVGRSGYLEGTITAERLLVSGEVRGRVECETVEIVESGKVFGEVASQGFIIEPGGQFVGESLSRGEVRKALEREETQPEPQVDEPIMVADPEPEAEPLHQQDPVVETAGSAQQADPEAEGAQQGEEPEHREARHEHDDRHDPQQHPAYSRPVAKSQA